MTVQFQPRRAIGAALCGAAAYALSACQQTPPPVVGTIAPTVSKADGQDAFAASTPASVALNPGDVIAVSVYREPELSLASIPVAADGSISVPLIGRVTAAGRSTHDLADDIRSRFAAQGYLKRPEVAVNIVEAGSYKVTVEGAVATPGVYAFVPGQRMSSAIAMAAGPRRTAKLDQVAVFRQTSEGMTVAKFDYRAVQQGTMLDPELRPGDRIVIGTSGLGQLWQDVLQSIPVFAVFSQI